MFGPTFNLWDLNGSNGFAINGIAASDWSGFSVSSAGDVNGDGIDAVSYTHLTLPTICSV